jgi:hypothetical protein
VVAFALSFQCSLSLTAMTGFGNCDFGYHPVERCQDAVGRLSKFCDVGPVASYKAATRGREAQAKRCFGARSAFDGPTRVKRRHI